MAFSLVLMRFQSGICRLIRRDFDFRGKFPDGHEFHGFGVTNGTLGALKILLAGLGLGEYSGLGKTGVSVLIEALVAVLSMELSR